MMPTKVSFMTQLSAPESLRISFPDRIDKTGSLLVIFFLCSLDFFFNVNYINETNSIV